MVYFLLLLFQSLRVKNKFLLIFLIISNHIFFDFSFLKTFALASVVFPIYLYSSARMLDSIFFYLQTMLSRFLYFVYPKNIVKLKSSREALAKEVLEFVNVHIRDADPKYEEERILFKKEADRGDSEKEVMIRRNSQRKSKKYLSDEISNILSIES